MVGIPQAGDSRIGQSSRHENGGVHEPIYITSIEPAVLAAESRLQSMATETGLVSGDNVQKDPIGEYEGFGPV